MTPQLSTLDAAEREAKCSQAQRERLVAGAQQFAAEGWCCIRDLGIGPDVLRGVRHDADFLDADMVPGKTYGDAAKRKDRMLWLAGGTLAQHGGLRELDDILHDLVCLFGRELEASQLGLRLTGRELAMLACYDPGGYFCPHKDGGRQGALSFEDSRILTAVYYLNAGGWDPADGGQLRLRPQGGRHVDIFPEEDTLVLLRADEMEHEVCRSVKRRLAFTIFFQGFCGEGHDGAKRLLLRSEKAAMLSRDPWSMCSDREAISANMPMAVLVIGGEPHWLNQHLFLADTSSRLLGRGPHIYAATTEVEGRWLYMWHDAKHEQWKISFFKAGEGRPQKSLFTCRAPGGVSLARVLRPWKPMGGQPASPGLQVEVL